MRSYFTRIVPDSGLFEAALRSVEDIQLDQDARLTSTDKHIQRAVRIMQSALGLGDPLRVDVATQAYMTLTTTKLQELQEIFTQNRFEIHASGFFSG